MGKSNVHFVILSQNQRVFDILIESEKNAPEIELLRSVFYKRRFFCCLFNMCGVDKFVRSLGPNFVKDVLVLRIGHFP